MLKIAVVVGGVVVTCVLGAGIAAADNDTEGGHCEYGDASVNLNPSCDTSGGGGSTDEISRVLVPGPITTFTPPTVIRVPGFQLG